MTRITNKRRELLNGASRQIEAPKTAPPTPAAGFEILCSLIFCEDGWKDVLRFAPSNMREDWKNMPPPDSAGRFLIEAVLGSLSNRISMLKQYREGV